MLALTMTVYLYVNEDELPNEWAVADWLEQDESVCVAGWSVEFGHGDFVATDPTREAV